MDKVWAAQQLHNMDVNCDIECMMVDAMQKQGILVAYTCCSWKLILDGVKYDEIDISDEVYYVAVQVEETLFNPAIGFDTRRRKVKIWIDQDWTQKDEPPMKLRSNLPCEYFDVLKDGEKFCRGIVMSVWD